MSTPEDEAQWLAHEYAEKRAAWGDPLPGKQCPLCGEDLIVVSDGWLCTLHGHRPASEADDLPDLPT
jgi:hypothetical protein